MPKPTPASHGYTLPAEWEPQKALWFSWPHHPHTWPHNKPPVEKALAHLIATASHYQQININYSPPNPQHITTLLQQAKAHLPHIHIHPIPTNDTWCRDHGPLFVKHNNGTTALIDWHYNAWGGKFPPWQLDDQVPLRIAQQTGLTRYTLPLTSEGGAIETNGQGLLITTESALLTDTRNPHKTKQQIETLLHASLGTREIIWLKKGLIGDDTDGHIDTLTRFYNPTSLLTVTDPGGINEKQLLANRQKIQAYRSPTGQPLTLTDLPLPQPIKPPNKKHPLPASYANFLLINNAVLIPSYAQPKADQQALHIISQCFPQRNAHLIDSSDIILEGGALHCLCTNQPA